jgi:putative transposase
VTGGLTWGIEPICQQLQVAPSSYYETRSRPPSQREQRDRELGPQLVTLFQSNYSVYGRRKLTRAAKKHGLDIGRDQVARLMRREGIRGASRAKKRFTTHSDKNVVRAPDLVNRNFTASRPDQLWVADFTYCSTWSGVIYVAFITDVFSRRIVGWKASRTMTATLVVDALNMAAWTRRHRSIEQLTCHTDAGSQYVSIAYTDRLGDYDINASIGTVGDSFDNAMAESMFAIFKTELFRNPAVLADYGGHWKGLDDLEIATCAWVSWFNEERIHGELGDLTPAEVEADYIEQSQTTAA